MNNKVNFLRGTSTEYATSTKDNDTFYYTTDDEKLYLGNKEITGGGVTVDDTLSDTSKNPVQNKVINAALNSKANLSDIPTTLPANGGNAQALTDYNSTDVRLMLGWRGASLDSTVYLAGYDTSELESNGIVKIKDINADKAYVGNAGNADTIDGKHASDFALKTDIPTTLPANGGNAATVNGHSVNSDVPAGAKFTDTVQTHPSYTARTGVPTANVAPAFGGTFTVSQPVSDATGHITAINSRTITIPSTAASASTAGLVSTGAQTLAGNKTFNGQVIPAGASAVGTAQARKIYAGTSDMTAGTTKLETGAIYLVYE